MDYEYAIGTLQCHFMGLLVLTPIGALRSLCACPMFIASDGTAPIFGASMTSGIGYLNPITRWSSAPPVQDKAAWLEAVGIPVDNVDDGDETIVIGKKTKVNMSDGSDFKMKKSSGGFE